MHRPTALLLGVLALLAMALTPSTAFAKKKKVFWYQYAVPFTCGTNATDPGRTLMGDHATVIHAVNGNPVDATLHVGLSLTFPGGNLSEGWRSERAEVTLSAGAATQASCQDALDLASLMVPPPFPIPPYVQGYAVIQSSRPLDVQRSHAVEMAGGQVALTSQAIAGRPIVPPPAP